MFLRDRYKIVAAGFSNPQIDNVDFVHISKTEFDLLHKFVGLVKLKGRRFEDFYWTLSSVRSAFDNLKEIEADLIIANDIEVLPLAARLSQKTGMRVFLDAHEYTPREYDDNRLWRFVFQNYWKYICQKYLPYVSAMTTVCQGIAEEYERNFGTQCEVITNAPFFFRLEPSVTKKDTIRIIHHGTANESRGLENMLHLVDYLDERFFLDFMLVNNKSSYFENLCRIGKGNSRITFKDPVPMLDIIQTINEYDIGLYLLNPSGFNNEMALPNKLFEFIHARLAVAIWPSPEMARVVKEYDLGVVSDEFSIPSMAKHLNALGVENITHFKNNSDCAATLLCAEKNRDKLRCMVADLIGS
jgi:hypothetical protein